jgi:hypothetical protein
MSANVCAFFSRSLLTQIGLFCFREPDGLHMSASGYEALGLVSTTDRQRERERGRGRERGGGGGGREREVTHNVPGA